MAYKTTAETAPYKTPAKRDFENAPAPKGGQKASYTPSAAINPFAYGKDGGKASFNNPPSVTVIEHSVAQAPPAMPGTLKIGEDKNVSTPVSG